MSSEGAEILALIEAGLGKIHDPHMREQVRAHLTACEEHLRQWDYAVETVAFPCWWVARWEEHSVAIVHSRYGHGRTGDGWGVVSIDDFWFGPDGAWFETLEEAAEMAIPRDGDGSPV